MFCAKCQNDLRDCTCPDIEERLAELADSPHFIYRACLKCRNHYARCRCEEPVWGTSEQLRTEKPMDEDAIRKLMQADLEAAGLDPEKYPFKCSEVKTHIYPALWYCKDCLKKYRYKAALYNHIFDKHRPRDPKARLILPWRASEKVGLTKDLDPTVLRGPVRTVRKYKIKKKLKKK